MRKMIVLSTIGSVADRPDYAGQLARQANLGFDECFFACSPGSPGRERKLRYGDDHDDVDPGVKQNQV